MPRCPLRATGRERRRRERRGIDRIEPRRTGEALICRGGRKQPRAVRARTPRSLHLPRTRGAAPARPSGSSRADRLGRDHQDPGRASEFEARTGAGERRPAGAGKAAQAKQPRAALLGKAFGKPFDVPAHGVADGESAPEELFRGCRAERRACRPDWPTAGANRPWSTATPPSRSRRGLRGGDRRDRRMRRSSRPWSSGNRRAVSGNAQFTAILNNAVGTPRPRRRGKRPRSPFANLNGQDHTGLRRRSRARGSRRNHLLAGAKPR